MASVKLDSGVILQSNNDSVIRQYLKYGAVEITEKPVKKIEEAPVENNISNKGRKTK